MKNMLKPRKLVQAVVLIIMLVGVCLYFIGGGYTQKGTALETLGAVVLLIIWGYDNRDNNEGDKQGEKQQDN